MSIKSTTRAPRKSKVASVTASTTDASGTTKTVHLDTPEQIEEFLRTEPKPDTKSDFRRYCEAFAPHIESDCSTTRWAVAIGAGIVAQIGSGALIMSLISAFVALPTLGGIIWLLAFITAFLAALVVSARIGDFVVKCITSKYDVIAFNAVRNLFNSKKVVAS